MTFFYFALLQCASLSFSLFLSPLSAADPAASSALNVRINNRVLAKINDSAITVLDLAKQLEGHLRHRMSDQTIDAKTRLQFYNTYWTQVLRDRIDRELILLDAQERGLSTSRGEIREEMDQLFGPDINSSLQKINLTFDAAFESVKREITVRRMLLYRAHIPAQGAIGPDQVRKTYAEFANSHHQNNRWIYRIISVTDGDEEKSIAAAQRIYNLALPCDDWDNAYKAINSDPQAALKAQISDIYTQRDIDLSDPYRLVLQSLKPGSCSSPTPYTADDGKTHYRIFYLIERENRPCPPLHQIAGKLREMLIEQRAGEIIDDYLSTLRGQYAFQLRQIEQNFPANFSPFSPR